MASKSKRKPGDAAGAKQKRMKMDETESLTPEFMDLDHESSGFSFSFFTRKKIDP